MPTETFILWQETLLQCQTLSAVALYYSTLEPGILWSKSRLQVRQSIFFSFVLDSACQKIILRLTEFPQ